MKILAINASHRGRLGCTQLLLDKMAEGAVAAGADFEVIVLTEKTVNPCQSCGYCGKPDTLGHCIYEDVDDVKTIFECMRAADVVIYGSPVYVFGLTGRMKTFMDRFNSTAIGEGLLVTRSGLIFHPVDRQVLGKPMVILTLCSNVEQETVKNTISYFRTFARYLDAPIVGTLVRKMSGALEEQKDSPLAQEVCDAYVQAGRELAVAGRISSATERKANQPLIKVPLLDLLLHFRFFKQKMIERVNQERHQGRKSLNE